MGKWFYAKIIVQEASRIYCSVDVSLWILIRERDLVLE